MRWVFIVHFIFILVLVFDRASLVRGGGWVDLFFLMTPLLTVGAYFLVVVFRMSRMAYVSAFLLIINFILFCWSGVAHPLGGYLYSFLYCAVMSIIFLPGVYFSVRPPSLFKERS